MASEPIDRRSGERSDRDPDGVDAGPVAAPTAAAGDPDEPGPDASSLTLAVPPRCPTRTRAYRRGHLTDEGFAAEQISHRLDADRDVVIWLDLQDPDTNDLQILVQEFGLHPLAVEDAVSPHQRPKVDRYPTHLFVNLYAVGLEADGTSVRTGELSAFITHRALITVRKDEFDIDAVIGHWDLNRELITEDAEHSRSAIDTVSFLCYGMLDAVVDGHYAAVEELDDATEELEGLLFAEQHGDDIRRRAYQLGAALASVRRVVTPMQEVVSRLTRPELHLVDHTLLPYFHDVTDHVIRAADTIDGARDRIDRVLTTELNEQGARLNEITKRLAAWAAIIAVPTAVTGFFGQNVPYPGAGTQTGFLVSCALIIVMAAGLWTVLRKNHWL